MPVPPGTPVAAGRPAAAGLPAPVTGDVGGPADYVDPFIGTGGDGHTFPGAAVPFGMVQLSPDTGGTQGNWLSSAWKWCAGYHYSDTSILGFSHTHRSGMGAGDWGDVLIMPTTGELRVTPGPEDSPGEGYRSSFSHEDELAQPGYYSVILKDYDVKVELTATTRAGFHRYTFPESSAAHILIDLARGLGDYPIKSVIRIVGNDRVEGYRRSTGLVLDHTVYFSARFSRPFDAFGIWRGDKIEPGGREASGRTVGAYVDYATTRGERILVKVGISYTSVEEARSNLDCEIPHWDFDLIKNLARATWNRELGRVEVEPAATDPGDPVGDRSRERKVVFYTALYHCLLFPGTFSDVDGTYTVIGNRPGKTRTVDGFVYYSDFSVWDTFRAEMPLLTLIQPDRVRDMVRTMLAQYESSGWLPTPQQFGNFHTEGMIGDHSASVILDARLKGVGGFDLEEAYTALWKNAMVEGVNVIPGVGFGQGRYGVRAYRSLGYLPADFNLDPKNPLFLVSNIYNEATSRTLEYAYDDFCVGWLAKLLDKEKDYRYFMRRALNYRNVFDPETGFMRGRSITGRWMNPSDFDPTVQYAYYTEGNAWQWTWSVFHDVGGLMELMGGREAFARKLDEMFQASEKTKSSEFFSADISGMIGQYAHGNEPSHHVAYLYDYAGQPWKTQARVRQVMEELYHATPDGLCGNEDMGQMSAWYVFSSIGFYPIAPGIYVIGSPIFEKAVIHLGSGATVTVEARGVSAENKYIQSATLNGRPLDRPWFSHSEVAGGGSLVLEMGPEPNTGWGADPDASPPSMLDLVSCGTP